MMSPPPPPPRGPLRISADTDAATSSKKAQHARNSVILRSSSASSIGSISRPDGENEMPQKSVEPVPTRSSASSSASEESNSAPIPAARAIGRYRARYDSSSSNPTSGVFAPRLQPGQSHRETTA